MIDTSCKRGSRKSVVAAEHDDDDDDDDDDIYTYTEGSYTNLNTSWKQHTTK